MRSVVIEGSVTPAAGILARGERRAVAWTNHIADLIAKGYVILVEDVSRG